MTASDVRGKPRTKIVAPVRRPLLRLERRPLSYLWLWKPSVGALRRMKALLQSAFGNLEHHLRNNHGRLWMALTHRRGDLAKSRLQLSAGPRGLSDVREIRGLVLSTLS